MGISSNTEEIKEIKERLDKIETAIICTADVLAYQFDRANNTNYQVAQDSFYKLMKVSSHYSRKGLNT